MLLAIQNLIEDLNRNYLADESIEEEVIKMTKTLYDPEVEKNGMDKGEKKKALEIAKSMKLKEMNIDLILELTGLTKKEVEEI